MRKWFATVLRLIANFLDHSDQGVECRICHHYFKGKNAQAKAGQCESYGMPDFEFAVGQRVGDEKAYLIILKREPRRHRRSHAAWYYVKKHWRSGETSTSWWQGGSVSDLNQSPERFQ